MNSEQLPDQPVKKSRKGPAPKLFGNELCKICDAKATGFHYNVLSCEACKVSFRCLQWTTQIGEKSQFTLPFAMKIIDISIQKF